MKKNIFLSGSQAVSEGAIYSGCRYYYSTPKPINNEILKYMSFRIPEVNGIFSQAENEKSAIGMVIGSSAAGERVMTSSITEGVSAMIEGINYLSAMELPCVIVSIMYGRDGIINLEHGQYGYSDFVKSSSHVNNKFIVLAPDSVQSCYDLTIKAYELADKYRNPVIVLIDTYLAVQSQSIEIYRELLHPDKIETKHWKIGGAKNREPRVYKSFYDDDFSKYKSLIAKLKKMEEESLYEEFFTESPKELVVSFGSIAKHIQGSVLSARAKGRDIGLFIPLSLSPFPKQRLIELAEKVDKITVVEVNTGFMYSDVLNIIRDKTQIDFIGETEEIIGFRDVFNEFVKRFDY